MCDLFWKFHENPFIRFPVMLLTDTFFLENTVKDTQYPRSAINDVTCLSALNLKKDGYAVFTLPYIP